jgi:hypothetical protein
MYTLWLKVSAATADGEATDEAKADITQTLNVARLVFQAATRQLGIKHTGSDVYSTWKGIKEKVHSVEKGGDGSGTWEAVDKCFEAIHERLQKYWPAPMAQLATYLHSSASLMSTVSPDQPVDNDFLNQFVEVACELHEEHLDQMYKDYIAETNELVLKGMMNGSLTGEEVTELKDRLRWQITNFLEHFISYTEPSPDWDFPHCSDVRISIKVQDFNERYKKALPGEIPLSQVIANIKQEFPGKPSKPKKRIATNSQPSEGGATASEDFFGVGKGPGMDETESTEQAIDMRQEKEAEEADTKDQDSEKEKKQDIPDEKDHDTEKEEQIPTEEKSQDTEKEEQMPTEETEKEELIPTEEEDQDTVKEEQVPIEEKSQDTEKEEPILTEENYQDSEKEIKPGASAVETTRDTPIEAKAMLDFVPQAIQPTRLSVDTQPQRVKVPIQDQSDDEESPGQAESAAMKEVGLPEEGNKLTTEQYQAMMDSLQLDDAANLIIQVSNNLERMWTEDVNEVRGFLESKEGSSAVQKRLQLREMKLLEELETIRENRQQAKDFLDFRSGRITAWPVRTLQRPPVEEEQHSEATPLQKVDPNVLHDILHRVANPVGVDKATSSDHAKQVLQAWYILLPEFSDQAIVSLAKDLNIETEDKDRPALLEAITAIWSSQGFHTSSDTASYMSSGEKEKRYKDDKDADESEQD